MLIFEGVYSIGCFVKPRQYELVARTEAFLCSLKLDRYVSLFMERAGVTGVNQKISTLGSRRFEHLTLNEVAYRSCVRFWGLMKVGCFNQKPMFLLLPFVEPQAPTEGARLWLHGRCEGDGGDVFKTDGLTTKTEAVWKVLNDVHEKQELRWLPVVAYRKELALRWEPGAAYAANWHGCWAHS